MQLLTPTLQLDDHRIAELDAQIESSRAPCENCRTKAILSENSLCADCEREAAILAQHDERPGSVYTLTENLCYYPVLSIRSRPNTSLYEVTVPELTFSILCDLEDFFLDIPSLVTTGISYANDAILRFNTLHKQYLTSN